jgi:predicted dithiol-disulfide oxidoreductase (DUF899 family)
MPSETLLASDLERGLRFPNETPEYRAARDALLREEIELRRHLERVAAQRRALPLGGEVKDYLFQREAGPVRMSELFEDGKDTLLTYCWMFGPERKTSCSSCQGFLDSLDGAARHVRHRMNLAVVSRSPVERMEAFGQERGWRFLPMVSSGANTFNADYFALVADGVENPMIHVFRKIGGTVRHAWGSEMFYAPSDPGQHPRHNGTVDLIWNLLDLSPHGRGDDEDFPHLDD